jgi:hypothetical protein
MRVICQGPGGGTGNRTRLIRFANPDCAALAVQKSSLGCSFLIGNLETGTIDVKVAGCSEYNLTRDDKTSN